MRLEPEREERPAKIRHKSRIRTTFNEKVGISAVEQNGDGSGMIHKCTMYNEQCTVWGCSDGRPQFFTIEDNASSVEKLRRYEASPPNTPSGVRGYEYSTMLYKYQSSYPREPLPSANIVEFLLQ